MADKSLKAKIKLKYDTLSNWTKNSSVVLLKGEVAICEIPLGSSEQQVVPPAILMKVGDGVKIFAQLPWISGLAADVYNWAKQNSLTISTEGQGVITGVSWDSSLNSNKGGLKFTKTSLAQTLSVNAGKYVSGITQDNNGKITLSSTAFPTINGKALTGNITLSASDVGALPNTTTGFFKEGQTFSINW